MSKVKHDHTIRRNLALVWPETMGANLALVQVNTSFIPTSDCFSTRQDRPAPQALHPVPLALSLVPVS